jgi:DNA mismatch repair protein MutH
MDTKDWKVTTAPTCPHCKTEMQQMDARHLDWDSPYLWVCYNDECKLFKKGWEHMMESVGQLVSYRYMVHPQDGTAGVIPAFSGEYLKIKSKSANPNYSDE